MLESYVDLSYRGLPLGRRVKLTQVRPSTGYLEHPTPMPVGTPVAITTDDGVVIDAVVTAVYEQVGAGSGGTTDRPPGMLVRPALADDRCVAWWKERVTLPELEARRAPERTRSVTVRPRTHTVPHPVADGAAVSLAAVEDTTIPVAVEAVPVARIELASHAEVEDKKTMVMDAVDQELLERLSRPTTEVDTHVRSTGEHPVVDDGKMTTLMDAVDPAVLGLEAGASGPIAAADADDEEDEDSGVQPIAGTNGNGDKKSKKRRKKRR